jgi:O-acetyl-ADP-ribose deacetylase (regulator of RNase III)
MIKEVTGDILLTKAQALAHGVAPNDDFHQGLALSLREYWPDLYKDFRHYCKTYHPESGNLWVWTNAEGKRIVNLFTQEGSYHDKGTPGVAKLEHVRHALKNLKELAKKENFTSIALPKLATGVGRLEWDDVFPLIQSNLEELNIPIYVYSTFKKGVKAEE